MSKEAGDSRLVHLHDSGGGKKRVESLGTNVPMLAVWHEDRLSQELGSASVLLTLQLGTGVTRTSGI